MTTHTPLIGAALHRADVQVCLVSAQPTPNLTPLLDPAFVPRRVVLLVSTDMRERAAWLADVVRQRGIAVEQLDIADAWDMQGVCDRLVAWLDKQGDACSVALNVTGGTKPMAMAAQQAFAMADKPVFYVHQGRDELLWLTPRLAPTRMANRLTLKPYLHAHGWQVMDRPALPRSSDAMRRLTDELVLQVGSLGPALGTLNWYAHQCESLGRLEIELEDRDHKNPGFMALVDKFAAAQACALHGGKLQFPNEASRFYCNGGWLEHHVAGLLNGLRQQGKIQDLAVNLKVRSLNNDLNGDGGSNELDVAVLAHNRLHIIECKTSVFRERDSAAPAVYKLDALAKLGGLNTRGMLVSYRSLIDGDRQRARDLRIRTVVGSAIANLGQELQRWLTSDGA